MTTKPVYHIDKDMNGKNILLQRIPEGEQALPVSFSEDGGLWRLKRIGERGSYSTAGKNEK